MSILTSKKEVPTFTGRLYTDDGNFSGNWVRRAEVDSLLDEIKRLGDALDRWESPSNWGAFVELLGLPVDHVNKPLGVAAAIALLNRKFEQYQRCLYRANGRLTMLGQEHEKLDYSGGDGNETCAPPALSETDRERATELLATAINVYIALEKKTRKELVDLMLAELDGMEVSTTQEQLIEELCTRVHPDWYKEIEPSAQKARDGKETGGSPK